jgi:hypothetical protein
MCKFRYHGGSGRLFRQPIYVGLSALASLVKISEAALPQLELSWRRRMSVLSLSGSAQHFVSSSLPELFAGSRAAWKLRVHEENVEACLPDHLGESKRARGVSAHVIPSNGVI